MYYSMIFMKTQVIRTNHMHICTNHMHIRTNHMHIRNRLLYVPKSPHLQTIRCYYYQSRYSICRKIERRKAINIPQLQAYYF